MGKIKTSPTSKSDQSHFPFFIDAERTYEYVEPGAEDHDTWISQPGSGLDKT